MLKKIIGTFAALTLVILVSPPATAQVRAAVSIPGLEIRIGHQAPPALRHERIPARPSRDSVWLPGNWDWQSNQWAWTAGRWERPDNRGSWVKARYAREGTGWRYEPAHWSSQRLVEGDDYRQWKNQHGHDRDHNHQ
jgi:hypothetical protein